MNRCEFWNKYAEMSGVSQEKAKIICESVFLVLEDCIKQEERVSIYNFGTFKKKIKPAHKKRAFAKDEYFDVPEKEVIVFEPSENFGTESEQLCNPEYKKLSDILFVGYRETEEQKEFNRRMRTNERIAIIRERAQTQIDNAKKKKKKSAKKAKSNKALLNDMIAGLTKAINKYVDIDDED